MKLTILSKLGDFGSLRLGLLVSQDADIDGSLSAKPFIDNMIHVISEPGSQIFSKGFTKHEKGTFPNLCGHFLRFMRLSESLGADSERLLHHSDGS